MKAVAFDLGRVIFNVDFGEFMDAWAHYGLDSREDCWTFFSDLHGQQDVGLTTIDRALRERFSFLRREHVSHLMRAWDNSLIINDEMFQFMQECKSKYNVAILSNMGKEHREVIKEKFPAVFKDCILHLSCEVGARKPTKLYFQSFMMDHKNEFYDAAYIDDLPENLVTGSKYGLRPINFVLEEFEALTSSERSEKLNSIRAFIEDSKSI